MSIKVFAAAALLVCAGPAFAQDASIHSTSGQHDQRWEEQKSYQANDATRPHVTTRSLNRRSAIYSNLRAQRQAQYQHDRRAYMASVMARHRQSVNRYHRRYARQELAYADAMAAWRRQVNACHRGDRRACRAPAPRVADFY